MLLNWCYDFNYEMNFYLMECLEINIVFNVGVMVWGDKILFMLCIEVNDVKFFFGIVESLNGVDGFCFWFYFIVMFEISNFDMNVYDICLVEYEDGWIYGIFCVERKDVFKLNDILVVLVFLGLV